MRLKAFLLGMFFTVAGVFAQDFYTIQLRSLSVDKPLTESEIESGIWKHQVGVYTKYFLGRFDTQSDAKAALSPSFITEFPGAFVVSSQNIFIVSSTVVTPTVVTPTVSTPTPLLTKVESTPAPVVAATPFVEETVSQESTTYTMTPPTIRPGEEVPDTVVAIVEVDTTLAAPVFDMYTVQIAAYKYPLATNDFTIDYDVMEFYCRDNVYRYTVGKTADKTVADKLLKRVKLNGYPEAFLIDYSKYELYRLE